MSIGREIRSKIASIKNTQKITRAMELVAASKMRKAQERMITSRPFATKIKEVVSHVANAHSEYRHPYLIPRAEIKRVGFIIVSSDRGLCGGLNNNLFKTALLAMQEWHQKGVAIDLCLIGSKAVNFFKRHGGNIVAYADHIGDAPSITDLVSIVKVMLDRYDERQIDRLFIGHNEFINSMVQKPRLDQLLPIVMAEDQSKNRYWDYIYEPDAKEVLDVLFDRYIESQVFQGVVENIASEQAARMVAMKSATDNAGELISELQLTYNKARQAAITREINEIVSGASAV